MAVQTNITSNADFISFLESLGVFESVTESGGIITMKAAGGHTVATYNNGAWTLYASETVSAAVAGTGLTPKIGFKCTGGGLLACIVSNDIVSGDYQMCISQNQDGVPVFAWHGKATGGNTYYYDIDFHAVAFGDESIGAYQTDQRIMNQEILMPIVTRPPFGQTSYSTDAYLLYCTHAQNVQRVKIGAETFFCSGWFAIRDEV